MAAERIVRWLACVAAALWLVQVAVAQGAEAARGTVGPAAAAREYEGRAAKLAGDDAKGWLGLADFCEAHLLLPQREASLRKAVAADAENLEAHRRLDEVKVGAEWLPSAEADARAAKEHEAKNEVYYGKVWISTKSFGGARAADRARFGWPIQVRVDSPRCTVYSAASYEETKAVATVVQRATAGYEALYGKGRKLDAPKAFPVHLFNTADTFAAQFARMTKNPGAVPKGFAGAYNPQAKALFVSTDIGSGGWNEDTLLHTVAHETVHALDDLEAGIQLAAMPAWICEGRAIYSQYSLVGRQWVPGALNVGSTDGRGQEVEKAYKTASLETLLGLDQKAFMQNAAANYAVAWSFTHFLLHGGDGKYREKFLKFVAGCPQRSFPKDFERVVGKVADLVGPYKAYVETDFLPAVKAFVNADRKAKGLQGEWK